MAKQSNGSKIKEIFLVVFLVVSILLVAFQWVEGIYGSHEDTNPAFVRPTAIEFEVDDEAYENWNQLEATPTHQHRRTQTPEPLPTITP